MTTAADEAFLQRFYAALDPQLPLDPSDARRVPLYELAGQHATPTDDLHASIRWTPLESVHLFSGFRGTGKTTELRRLASLLRESGALVVLADMSEYLNFEDTIEISAFMLSLAGALGDALREREVLGKDLVVEDYWTRFRNFLTRTKVDIHALESSIELMGTKTAIKAALKQDASFRQQLAKHLSSEVSVSALLEDVHAFVGECVAALRRRHGDDARIVLIFDSIEQIAVRDDQGPATTHHLAQIFSTHAKSLRFEGVHVVYTVPPWLKLANKGVVGLYTGAFTLPCVKVRERDESEFEAGIALLRQVIERREPSWRRLFVDEASLARVILASGGYIRDLFRLLRACLLRARRELPLRPESVEIAIADVTNTYMPITHDDARWLHEVAQTHDAEVSSATDVPTLARYFDDHLVLCYANGREWYDVHPLVRSHVAAIMARRAHEDAP